jgi:hypothetical protein
VNGQHLAAAGCYDQTLDLVGHDLTPQTWWHGCPPGPASPRR